MTHKKVIRILQVGMSPYYGGTEAFLMSQYRAIDRAKVQFDFLNVYSEKIACQDEIETLGGHIYYLDMARHHGIKRYHQNLDRFFLENAHRFDGVHCNFQSLINVDILKYAKKYHIPVRIAHAHNAGYGTEPNILQKMLIQRNKRILLRSATHYFACSELAATWMFGRDAVVINNAIDVDKFAYSPKSREIVRKEMNLGNRPTIIFVGRLDPQKNPIFMVEVFHEILRRWPEAQLLIVGEGVLKEELEIKINDLGIAHSIKMLGSRTDVNALMQAADIFLLPSRFEGLGIVLVEAQAAGLPTFTSKDVVPKEVKITDLLEFISLKKTPKEWAERIVERGIVPRADTKQLVCDAGYDNKVNADKLADLYIKLEMHS